MVLVILRVLKIWYAEDPYPSPAQKTNYGSCMKSVLPTDLWDYTGDLHLVKKDDNLKEMCSRGWEQQVCPTPPTPVETARLIFPGQPTTNLSDPRFSHMLSGFSQQLQEDWGKGLLRYFLQQWYLEVWICFIFVSKSRTEIVSELNSIFHISGVAKF